VGTLCGCTLGENPRDHKTVRARWEAGLLHLRFSKETQSRVIIPAGVSDLIGGGKTAKKEESCRQHEPGHFVPLIQHPEEDAKDSQHLRKE